MWQIFKKKKLNQNRNADISNIRVVEFVMMRVWFMTKYEGDVCYFLHYKEEEEEYERWNIFSVNVTLIYQWVFYVGTSVCIWYFPSSAASPYSGAL